MTLILAPSLRAELRCRAEAGRMRGLVAEWCLITRDQLARGKEDCELAHFIADIAEVFHGARLMHAEGEAD